MIKDCYPHILQKYANVDDKQLLWELIKMEIRSETIRYSQGKSKELKKKTRKCYSRENRALSRPKYLIRVRKVEKGIAGNL